MQKDFHYFATYAAAFLAGYTHEESLEIATADQFTDLCTRTFLANIKGPLHAATTQLQLELMDARTDPVGLQDITRIWASFHFLPYDLYAPCPRGSREYKEKYRLICRPNGTLVKETVELAKDRPLSAVGLAMHVLADTWAHQYFCGTPSLVINNTNYHFFELVPGGDGTDPSVLSERKIIFKNSLGVEDDFENGIYVNSLFQSSEYSIMNLGHGRAGHLPDYSFARYKYLPAWGNYEEITKDNPSDYMHAFTQMIYAMKYLRGKIADFELDKYDEEAINPYRDEIVDIFEKRRLDSSDDWAAFGKKLSGREIKDFDIEGYKDEYTNSPRDAKEDTWLGCFFEAALRQKSMITNRIFRSGNMQAGFSIDAGKMSFFKGIREYGRLIKENR